MFDLLSRDSNRRLGSLAIGRDLGDDLGLEAGAVGVAVVNSIVILTGELFKGLASSLGNEPGGEAAEKHEEGIDLKDVVHPGSRDLGGCTLGTEGSNSTLADDGSDLAG